MLSVGSGTGDEVEAQMTARFEARCASCQLKTSPLQVAKDAAAAGMDAKDYVVKSLKDGSLTMSCEDPDHPDNWPRNMFVWRSNILGSSGKGHEYFLKHLLGTSNGVQGKDLGRDEAKPTEVKAPAAPKPAPVATVEAEPKESKKTETKPAAAALPVPPYTTKSSGRSATSGSRLLRSMR